MAVLPTVVMVVRAAATRWVPLFDAAYFTVRSRDVLTTESPMVGAWSMGSRELGVWINNLGPLQLDLLAPFTRLDPYWGTALGVGATNMAAIVGVWLVARRLFVGGAGHGDVGVLGVMGATLVVQLNEGSLMLIEARQQLALVLPMWCLLWLAAATWHGHRWALPWMAFVASFVLQTHFTYAYQTIAVSGVAAGVLIWSHRHRWRSVRRTVAVTVGVIVASWAQPLWDQTFGTGNLGHVLGQGGGSQHSVGVRTGWSILAESGFVPPFFLPGSMGDLLRSGTRVSFGTAVVVLGVWALLLVGAIRGGRASSAGPAAAVALVALVASLWAAATIPPTEQFGIIAQNYYWAWPIGVFCMTVLVGAAARAARAELVRTGADPHGRGARLALSAGVAVACLPLLAPTNELPETAREWTVSRTQARPLMDAFRQALDEHDLDGPVLMDLGAVRHVRYTMLAELQRAGMDFRFSPGTTDLSRFGRRRCDDGTAAHLITLRGGADALLVDTSDTLLAFVPGVDSDQDSRLTALGREFGDALRAGAVTVDIDAIIDAGGDVPARLAQVLATPGMPARQLGTFLANWSRFGPVTVSGDLADDLAEWKGLEATVAMDRMAIYVRPLSPLRADRCDDIAPGDGFGEPSPTPDADVIRS